MPSETYLSEISFKPLGGCSARATEPTALTDLLTEGAPTEQHLRHPCGSIQTAIHLSSITLNSLVPFSHQASLCKQVLGATSKPQERYQRSTRSQQRAEVSGPGLLVAAPRTRAVSGLLAVRLQHPTGSQLSCLCAWTASYCSTSHEGYNN